MALGCFDSHISTRTFRRALTASLHGQLCVGKECPFSGVTKSGRVWRKVAESDPRSVGHQIRYPPRQAMSKAEWNRVASCPETSIYHSCVRVLSPLVLSNEALVLLKTAFPTSCEWLVLAEVYTSAKTSHTSAKTSQCL